MSGLQELGREEGGSELIAHVISRSLPVADNWIDDDVTNTPVCVLSGNESALKTRSLFLSVLA